MTRRNPAACYCCLLLLLLLSARALPLSVIQAASFAWGHLRYLLASWAVPPKVNGKVKP